MKNKKPTLKLTKENGNAFNLLAKAKKKADHNDMNWNKIQKEATNGDYDHLLQTMEKYFEVV